MYTYADLIAHAMLQQGEDLEGIISCDIDLNKQAGLNTPFTIYTGLNIYIRADSRDSKAVQVIPRYPAKYNYPSFTYGDES